MSAHIRWLSGVNRGVASLAVSRFFFSIMWNRRRERWWVCSLLFSKERVSEGPTEEHENLHDFNTAVLSEIEAQGVQNQV